jgi:C-terminal processing protease CtpA/Prc
VFEQLVEVNNEAVNNKSVEEITRLLKGVPNTPVTLTLKEA